MWSIYLALHIIWPACNNYINNIHFGEFLVGNNIFNGSKLPLLHIRLNVTEDESKLFFF